MAPIHPRSTDGVIAQLAKRVEELQSALARGPILPGYASTNLPANSPTGLEVFVNDLGLRAWWNGSAWIYPPQPIGSVVLTGSQPSITLPIPGRINYLEGVFTARKDVGGGGAFTRMRFNGDSGNNYQYSNTVNATPGNSGGSLISFMQMGLCAGASDTAGYFATGHFSIGNISSTAVTKSLATHSGLVCSTSTYYTATYIGEWNSTAAITSLTLLPDAGNLVTGSSLSLYGWG